MSKRGEGHEMLIIVIIGVALLAIIAVIVFILIATSTNTSKNVLEQDKQYTFDSSIVVRGLFNITTLEYADTEGASCSLGTEFQRPVTMTLRFQAYEVPDTCSFFIDDRLLRSERRLEPDCAGACPFKEFSRQFSLGEIDYRDDHRIKVCCNQICIEKPLPGLCNSAE